MADTYLPDIMDGLKKVIAADWDRLIPGHPGPDGRQIGTKTDARAGGRITWNPAAGVLCCKRNSSLP